MIEPKGMRCACARGVDGKPCKLKAAGRPFLFGKHRTIIEAVEYALSRPEWENSKISLIVVRDSAEMRVVLR